MSEQNWDRLQNELIATGAIFMALSQHPAITEVDIPKGDDEPGNAVVVHFDFLKSPYRITVTMQDTDRDSLLAHRDG